MFTDNFAMSVLFIIGIFRMDSYPFYCGHPDYVASIRTMSAIPHERGKIKLLLRKIFIKKFDRSQHFKRKQLFIVVSKKKKYWFSLLNLKNIYTFAEGESKRGHQ